MSFRGRVFDPFAGRGSSIYAAAAQDRFGLGIELNPVAWVYCQAKLHPAKEENVLRRLHELGMMTKVRDRSLSATMGRMPEFFRLCYSPRVLQFLLLARRELRWEEEATDTTLMAILLVYLHAKAGSGLSNQMRQSKAMSPPYAVRWWREHGTKAPNVDPVDWLEYRIRWRYQTGLPRLRRSQVQLGDSTRSIAEMAQGLKRNRQRFDLLLTSPPYYAVTNYQYDQWLRLWLLGHQPRPVAAQERSRGRFESKVAYRALLEQVFRDSIEVLKPDATLYIRTHAAEFTRETTIAVLRELFPHKHMEPIERPYQRKTQTSLFGDSTSKPGEVDIILRA